MPSASNNNTDTCFISFKTAISDIALPARFTYPFYYQPHPLCILAAEELQTHIKQQTDWQHNFGLTGELNGAIGKMFGVLLVENKNKEIGYLAGFSGKLAESNHHPLFVPPVFDLLDKDSFYHETQSIVNSLTQQIENLENSDNFIRFANDLDTIKQDAANAIETQRLINVENKKQRKLKRDSSVTTDNTINNQLSIESVYDKNLLKDFKAQWQTKIDSCQKDYNLIFDEIQALKTKRKELSSSLQQKIFEQYQFLNQQGKSKSLFDIFSVTEQKTPPAAAGECAAPKLLQYAFTHDLKPLAMAEFWWGASPKSEIRKHQHFYPACQGKCKPILSHMLEGMEVDDNPLLHNPGESKSIDIVYQDEVMLVINKPAGLLSVPGKDINDSVYSRLKALYPKATGPLIVHRLDMATSGLLVIALNKDVHKNLQQQFTKRRVKKRYCALLDGLIAADDGLIDLPIRVDLDDRPRQLVCYEYGKPAQTQWQVIERKDGKTKVYFYPLTGRTHQLRVHAAHSLGLNTAIVGDYLYGTDANRLHLHAEMIEFNHPISNELLNFNVDAEF